MSANIAEAKLTRVATEPIGSHVKICANSTYKGNPGGCVTPPSVWAASVNSAVDEPHRRRKRGDVEW